MGHQSNKPRPLIFSALFILILALYIGPRAFPRTHVAPVFTYKIVAVGDLHGDLPNALKVLQMAKVVDTNGAWSGQVDVLVQTGDIIDRGNDTIKLYSLMEELRVQAQHAGGEVVSLLGNHEWMNAIGDWRYVYESEITTFGSAADRQEMLSTGHIGRAWAQNYTTASRLPLHPSLGPPNTDYPPVIASEDEQSPLSHTAISFVHGGLAPTYPQLTPYPSAINALSKSLLHKLQHRFPLPAPYRHGSWRPELLVLATEEERQMYSSDGPLWFRGWARGEHNCSTVDEVLEKIGVRRMVMGHTPHLTGITSKCDGKIIIIDTGISRAYGGVGSALSIHYTLTPISSGKWKEVEVVTAIYEGREDVLANDERIIEGDFGAL